MAQSRYGGECPHSAVISTDRCNTLDSARAEGGVENEAKNADLLHGKSEDGALGALAKREVSPSDCLAVCPSALIFAPLGALVPAALRAVAKGAQWCAPGSI